MVNPLEAMNVRLIMNLMKQDALMLDQHLINARIRRRSYRRNKKLLMRIAEELPVHSALRIEISGFLKRKR